MENKQTRSSNIELLRIFAMLLVVMSHWGWAFLDVTFTNSFNYYFYRLFRAFGQLGVILFILISSYFLSKSKFKISSMLKLILQTILSILFLFLTFYILGKFGVVCQGGGYYNFSEFITNLLIFNSEYWFINIYLVIYLIFPFLNLIINNCSKKQFIWLILILFICFSLLPTLTKNQITENSIVNNFGWYILIYFLGAYLRRFPDDFKINKLLFFGLIGCIVIFINDIDFYQTRSNPCMILMAIIIFLLFSKLKMKNFRFINVVASSTFGVYLLHENRYTRFFVWKDIFKLHTISNKWFFPLYSIFSVVVVFAICSIISLIMQYVLINPLIKLLNKPLSKIPVAKIFPETKIEKTNDKPTAIMPISILILISVFLSNVIYQFTNKLTPLIYFIFIGAAFCLLILIIKKLLKKRV